MDSDSTPPDYWYWTQAERDAHWESCKPSKKEYTRAEQLFDAALTEAQHGDPREQKFFFVLAAWVLEKLKA